jgi:hypothetical protein
MQVNAFNNFFFSDQKAARNQRNWKTALQTHTHTHTRTHTPPPELAIHHGDVAKLAPKFVPNGHKAEFPTRDKLPTPDGRNVLNVFRVAARVFASYSGFFGSAPSTELGLHGIQHIAIHKNRVRFSRTLASKYCFRPF